MSPRVRYHSQLGSQHHRLLSLATDLTIFPTANPSPQTSSAHISKLSSRTSPPSPSGNNTKSFQKDYPHLQPNLFPPGTNILSPPTGRTSGPPTPGAGTRQTPHARRLPPTYRETLSPFLSIDVEKAVVRVKARPGFAGEGKVPGPVYATRYDGGGGQGCESEGGLCDREQRPDFWRCIEEMRVYASTSPCSFPIIITTTTSRGAAHVGHAISAALEVQWMDDAWLIID